MALRNPILPVALAVVALVASCGRAPMAPSPARLVGAMGVRAQGAADPCDHAVASRIDPNAAVVGAVRRALVRTADGPAKPAFTEIKSPNQTDRAGGAGDITCIVLHHTSSAADARRIGMFFSKPSSKVSSNYVVGKDGDLVECVDDAHASWHAGRSAFKGRDNVNHFSIGIEICNLGDNKDPYPQAQYEALGKLMAYLMVRYKVNWSNVTRHRDVALPLGRKTDTSDNFDRKLLEQLTVEAGGPKVEAESRFGLRFPNFN